MTCRLTVGWLLILCSLQSLADDTSSLRLIDAVKTGESATVQALLQQRVDVNVKERDGTTALHWAVRADDFEMAESLISSGADVDAANRYGVTPLLLASSSGNAELIQRLLDAGADPNTIFPDGLTALMSAARTGSGAAVRILLERGADPNVHEERQGETALIWAAAENQAVVITALANHGADVNARSAPTAFPRYFFGDGIVALMMTLPRGSWTPLMYAAREGALDATRALLAAGADPNLVDPEGTTALILAISNAHFDVAAELIEGGTDLNAADVTGMTPLYAAVDLSTMPDGAGRPAPKPTGKRRAADVVAMLLANGAEPNTRLKEPILQRHHAVGDPALGEGATPLLRAAQTADLPVMHLLLDGGADATLATAQGATAIMLAVGPPGTRRGGFYPVSDADRLDAISLLIDRGARINAINDDGQTALHAAARQGDVSAVNALLHHGAQPDIVDEQGRTAIDVALGNGSRDEPSAAHKAVAGAIRGFMSLSDNASAAGLNP